MLTNNKLIILFICIGSLSILLPSEFKGQLIVKRKGVEHSYKFEGIEGEDSDSELTSLLTYLLVIVECMHTFNFIAIYFDCECEARQISEGSSLILTYRLYRTFSPSMFLSIYSLFINYTYYLFIVGVGMSAVPTTETAVNAIATAIRRHMVEGNTLKLAYVSTTTPHHTAHMFVNHITGVGKCVQRWI